MRSDLRPAASVVFGLHKALKTPVFRAFIILFEPLQRHNSEGHAAVLLLTLHFCQRFPDAAWLGAAQPQLLL